MPSAWPSNTASCKKRSSTAEHRRGLFVLVVLLATMVHSGCAMKRRQSESPVNDPAKEPAAKAPLNGQPAHCGSASAGKGHDQPGDRASFVARRREGSRVVLAGGQVGWLRTDAVVRFDPAGSAEPQRNELGRPRGLAVAPAGLVALGQPALTEVVRVGASVERAQGYVGLTDDGIVRLWAEADGVWIVGKTDIQWLPAIPVGKLLEVGRKLALDVHGTPHAEVEVSRLSDGAFVHARGSEITRIAIDDTRQQLAVPTDVGLAVAIEGAGSRAWLSLLGGNLALVDLPPVRLVACVELGAHDHIHSFAADTGAVAVVVAEQATAGADPAWSVRVHDNAGKPLLRVALPWQPTAADTPDISVAIADGRVAVASAERLVVWDIATQKLLVDRN